MTDFILQHAAFEQDHPEEAQYAIALEASRRVQHERKHGTLDGYAPAREFPCPGWLRTVERMEGGQHIVACDACRFETTMRERPLTTAGGEW